MGLVEKCPSAFFSEEQQEAIMDELLEMMPKSKTSTLDCIMKVLFLETMIRIYQDIRRVSYEQAQEELLEGEFEETECLWGRYLYKNV